MLLFYKSKLGSWVTIHRAINRIKTDKGVKKSHWEKHFCREVPRGNGVPREPIGRRGAPFC